VGTTDVADDLITMKAAAAILNVSWQRVQQLVTEGKLRTVATDGMGRARILFRRGEVERLRVERGVGRYGRS
jgi:excisionase family DNA binding protein